MTAQLARRLGLATLLLALIAGATLPSKASSEPDTGTTVATLTEHNALEQRVTDLEQRVDELATPAPTITPTVVPTPTPSPTSTPTATPTTPAAAAPLIGMSAPAASWSARKNDVEATGGELQARRVFLQGFSSSLRLVEEAHAEGLLPVVSFKPGDWGNVAAGQSDAALRALATRLAELGDPVVVALHHEPDEKSTPVDVGEGGTAAEFAAMQLRAEDILDAAPNVQVWVIMNGWWWDGTRGALTDAQIAAWLPASLRAELDGVAADDYSPATGGNPAVVKARNRVEWAKRMGDVKSIGVGETNAFTAAELRDVFAYVKTEPLFRGGWVLVWNSTGGTYLPLAETGLLDDFQAILRSWPD